VTLDAIYYFYEIAIRWGVAKSLHIVDSNNNDTEYPSDSDVKVNLKAGEYSFYYEYDDGEIASTNLDKYVFSKENKGFEAYCGKSNIQQFAIEEDCCILFTNDWNGKISCSIIIKEFPSVIPPLGYNLTYNGAAQELVAHGGTDCGELLYSLDGENFGYYIPKATEAGNYTVYYKVEESSDWKGVSGSVEVTIKRASNKISIAPVANVLTYNGAAQVLVTPGSADYGTLMYSLDGINFSTDIPNAVEAGNYTVYYKVYGDSNYEGTEPETVTVTISKEDNLSTPVSEITDKVNKIWSYDRTIFIETTIGTDYRIIDLNGRTLVQSSTKSSHEEIQINKIGVFILIINGTRYKMYVN
jgi:hypothetical protein